MCNLWCYVSVWEHNITFIMNVMRSMSKECETMLLPGGTYTCHSRVKMYALKSSSTICFSGSNVPWFMMCQYQLWRNCRGRSAAPQGEWLGYLGNHSNNSLCRRSNEQQIPAEEALKVTEATKLKKSSNWKSEGGICKQMTMNYRWNCAFEVTGW